MPEDTNRSSPALTGRQIYTSAFFCSRAIRESPGDALTAVRLVDLHTIDVPPFQPNVTVVLPMLEADLIVIFKSETPQKFTAKVVARMPSGLTLDPAVYQCETDADIAGATLAIHVSLDFKIQGLYWFDVFIEDELATRVPLRITHNQASRS